MKRLYYNQGITIEVSQADDSDTVSTLPEVAFSPEIEALCDTIAAIVARVLDEAERDMPAIPSKVEQESTG